MYMRLLQRGMPSFNSNLTLHKYEAFGNDYLVLDEVNVVEGVLPFVPALCDRHRGVGADGLLVFDPDTFGVRIINPDGSEAEKSGNGLRIAAAHAVLDHGADREFRLRPPAGEAAVRVLEQTPWSVTTELDLGRPRVGPREVVAGVTGRAVDAGNPHFVVLEGPVDAARAAQLGAALERDPRFPQRTNVQLAEAPDRSTVRIEIWERGAGYTLASGTSAAAAAAACMEEGLVGDEVVVVMPGGRLPVRRLPSGNLLQVGTARRVFRAALDLATFKE
jgi:diaminopimelate epimerase